MHTHQPALALLNAHLVSLFQVAWLCDVMLPGFEESMRGLGTPGVDNPVDVIFCHNDLQEGNWLVQSDKSLKVCCV